MTERLTLGERSFADEQIAHVLGYSQCRPSGHGTPDLSCRPRWLAARARDQVDLHGRSRHVEEFHGNRVERPVGIDEPDIPSLERHNIVDAPLAVWEALAEFEAMAGGVAPFCWQDVSVDEEAIGIIVDGQNVEDFVLVA